ncbi:MAG: DNA polymerase IV [Janthinobacterium lividum]
METANTSRVLKTIAVRTILHLDLDAFYCSVEEKHDPTLRGKAFAVGGVADGRGVVSSCSYEARRFGVRSAMPMGQARGLCPHLICLPTNFPAYRAASGEIMARLRAVTPLVEQISIDEAFLDVTGLAEPGAAIAGRLQSEVRSELGLSCSLGIASNKLVAKIATDVGKSAQGTGQSPQAICAVPPGNEAAFLAPLAASALWGVGPKMAERLAELGIHTIGDIARRPDDDLRRRFGNHGDLLTRHSRGIDDRAVVTERETKSISRENTFSRDVRDEAALQSELSEQSRQVCRQLRQEGLCAATVKLKLRWSDFVTVTRQTSISIATQDAGVVERAVHKLLAEAWHTGQSVRLIGVGVSGLAPPLQLDLWDTRPAEDAAREKQVQSTLAALQARFGPKLIIRGKDLI